MASAAGSRMGPYIVLVGAGPTSAAICHMLKGSGLRLTVLDKGRSAGGRFTTAASRKVGKGYNGKPCRADVGAQYITSDRPIMQELVGEGWLKPFEGTIKGQRAEQAAQASYVAPFGFGALVRGMLAGAMVQQSTKVASSSYVPDPLEEGTRHLVFDGYGGKAAVVTVPAPQLFEIGGYLQECLEAEDSAPIRDALKQVEYSSRFACVLWFGPEKAAAAMETFPDAGVYVESAASSVVRFIANDTVKRGAAARESGVSITVHSSVDFGAKHVADTGKVGGAAVLEALQELYPNLPEPDETKLHKWKYSQVTKPFKHPDGAETPCLVLRTDPLLILAGDSFTESNFDGCLRSAEAAAELIKQHLC